MNISLPENYFEKYERLHKMQDEFVTLFSPVDLHFNQNLSSIVLSVGYGLLENHNFFDIIHKYDFDISKILYDEEHNLPPSPSFAYVSKLLIFLEDKKEY